MGCNLCLSYKMYITIACAPGRFTAYMHIALYVDKFLSIV